MKVYVLLSGRAYEGDDIQAIFMNKEEAIKELDIFAKESNCLELLDYDGRPPQFIKGYCDDYGNDLTLIEYEAK